jgi:hypothetical protein
LFDEESDSNKVLLDLKGHSGGSNNNNDDDNDQF